MLSFRTSSIFKFQIHFILVAFITAAKKTTVKQITTSVPSTKVPTKRVTTEHISTEHISTEHITTEHVTTKHTAAGQWNETGTPDHPYTEVSTEEVIRNSSYEGRSPSKIAELFKKFEIVPDVLDKAPEYELSVRYVGGIWPDFGTKHTPEELKYAPFALRWPAEKNTLYTLFMIDADSPSRANAYKRPYYHWGLANIPKYSILIAETLAKYIPPFPEQGTGEHRYVFVVYKQPRGRILYLEPRLLHLPDDTHRANFSVVEIAKRYKLEGPVAGNFLLSEYTVTTENPFEKHVEISHEDTLQDFTA